MVCALPLTITSGPRAQARSPVDSRRSDPNVRGNLGERPFVEFDAPHGQIPEFLGQVFPDRVSVPAADAERVDLAGSAGGRLEADQRASELFDQAGY